MSTPPRIVTLPSPIHTAPAGTTSCVYVPGASTPSHVEPPAALAAKGEATRSAAATIAAPVSREIERFMNVGPPTVPRAAGIGRARSAYRRLDGRLAVPVVQRLDPAEDTDTAKADLVRTRVVTDVVRLAGPVDEARHAVRASFDEVRDPCRRRTCD